MMRIAIRPSSLLLVALLLWLPAGVAAQALAQGRLARGGRPVRPIGSAGSPA